MKLSLLALAGLAAAQNAPGIMTNPGGAIPVGVMRPNITGFENSTVLPARGGYAICVSGQIPVQASAMNLKFNFTLPKNQSQLTNTFLEYITDGSTFPKQLMAGMQNVSGTYSIGATMCAPANGTTKNVIQVLTHGIGFDRYYWDFAPGYSYADYAAIEGYATFFYDRLGVGMSTKADPLNEVQTPLESAILAQLVQKLRLGQIGGRRFSNVVGVGHSFGSILTQGLTASQPSLFDAAVLTGFSTNGTGMPVFLQGNNLAIASQNSPYRFSALNTGYLVADTAISTQIAFFRAPEFDPNVLAVADATKGTVTYGELFSINAVQKPATSYTGGVIIVNGDADLPFCFGNCSYPVDKATAARTMLYPAAKSVGNNTFLATNTGHGVNLHYTATTAYQFIQNFVKALGY